MKQSRVFVIILFLFVILFCLLHPGSVRVYALNSQNELVREIEESLEISVFYQEETPRTIKCFDVNSSGYYAIGYKNNTIHVYNSLGEFQYGYHFHTDGTYGISLKENSILIYLGRNNIAVEVDSTGTCFNAEEVYFSKEFTDTVLNRTQKQIGTSNYYVERDIGIFIGDYSRLVMIDDTGAKTVLYDVTTRGYFAGAFHYVIISIFPIAGIIFLAGKIKKNKNLLDEINQK